MGREEPAGTTAEDIEGIRVWYGSAGLDGCNGKGRDGCNAGSVSCLASMDTLALAEELLKVRAERDAAKASEEDALGLVGDNAILTTERDEFRLAFAHGEPSQSLRGRARIDPVARSCRNLLASAE